MEITITGGSSGVIISGTADAAGLAKASFVKNGVTIRREWQWEDGVAFSETVPLQPGTYDVTVEFNGISYCETVTVPSNPPTSKVMDLCQ